MTPQLAAQPPIVEIASRIEQALKLHRGLTLSFEDLDVLDMHDALDLVWEEADAWESVSEDAGATAEFSNVTYLAAWRAPK